MGLCNRSLEPAWQLCPDAAKMPETTPFTARSKSASSKTMLGDLPPSSSVTVFNPRRAGSKIFLPAAPPPVKPMCRTRGWVTNGSPTSDPSPVTTLTTPLGNPASDTIAASSTIEAEVNSDGLTTTVQPAARAGASFQLVRVSGEFHGVMMATTPLGSYLV